MLVSCIMPTRGRPAFARHSLACFICQTWEPLELVVIDDADDRSFPDGLDLRGVQYHRMRHRLTIGQKRNIAISRANGDILCHFDDDDHSAPGRIADQVQRLETASAGVTGYCAMVFRDETGRRWKYTGKPNYALGTSLMYTRDFWKIQPFNPDLNEGEDNAMVHRAVGLVAVDAGEMMWATIHGGNTSDRRPYLASVNWKEVTA
jgi:glycosyltransferase involved in cell wall biosynthesis